MSERDAQVMRRQMSSEGTAAAGLSDFDSLSPSLSLSRFKPSKPRFWISDLEFTVIQTHTAPATCSFAPSLTATSPLQAPAARPLELSSSLSPKSRLITGYAAEAFLLSQTSDAITSHLLREMQEMGGWPADCDRDWIIARQQEREREREEVQLRVHHESQCTLLTLYRSSPVFQLRDSIHVYVLLRMPLTHSSSL